MTNPRVKLLRLTNCIKEYNIPAYNMLSQYYDLTIAHYGNKVDDKKVRFNQIILSPKKIFTFIYFEENIYELSKKYDAVLALGDLHVFPYMMLGFRKKRKFSLTFWGIGLSASYKKKFDEDRKLDWIRFRIMNKADSLVFYSDYPIKRYMENHVTREKLFVAPNTVSINERIEIPLDKKYFLFIGTLYKEKMIYELLNAYLITYNKNNGIAPLVIVGDGEEKSSIEKWIKDNKLAEKILLKGAIYEQNALRNVFMYAISCISPGQAGLSVLSSMAYGVPFITTYDAITGGELFNIQNEYNGLMYDGKTESLAGILELLGTDNKKVQKMSHNAQNYYFKYRTMDMMVNGLKDSIEFALKAQCIKKEGSY